LLGERQGGGHQHDAEDQRQDGDKEAAQDRTETVIG